MLALQRLGRIRAAKAAQSRAATAIQNHYQWVTELTETYNEHWQEEGRPSPYEPFPRWPYIRTIFDILCSDERIIMWEKSRDMLLTWCCVGYFTLEAMTVPQRGVLFQAQKEDKAIQLVDYAKCLYRRQPLWLQEAYPLARSMSKQGSLSLEFASGGYVMGIPGGADQIRSYHPWGYLNDESSFQPEAGECYDEALSAVKGKILFNSSAGPGWYADFRHDVVRTQDE